VIVRFAREDANLVIGFGQPDNPISSPRNETCKIAIAGNDRSRWMTVEETDDFSLVFLRFEEDCDPVLGVKRKMSCRVTGSIANETELACFDNAARYRPHDHSARFVGQAVPQRMHEPFFQIGV